MLRIGLLSGCRKCLHAILLTHIELPKGLSIRGTGLQKIACKGNLQSRCSGQLAPGSYVHVWNPQVGYLSEDIALWCCPPLAFFDSVVDR